MFCCWLHLHSGVYSGLLVESSMSLELKWGIKMSGIDGPCSSMERDLNVNDELKFRSIFGKQVCPGF